MSETPKKPDGPDKLLPKNSLERFLYRSEIPRHFWDTKLEKIAFRKSTIGGKPLSAVAQRQWMKTLINMPPRKPSLVVISSDPTDLGALYTGYYMLLSFRKLYNVTVASVNTAEKMQYMLDYPKSLLLHNILENASDERLENTRDLTERFKHSFRIVVVAGAKKPEKWAETKLRLRPDISFMVSDMTMSAILEE